MTDMTKNLKDAGYVLVGLGVISFQRAQAQGEELRTRLRDQRVQLDKQVGETRARLTKLTKDNQLTKLAKDNQLTKLARDAVERFEPVRETVEGRLDLLQDRLPERAKELVGQARGAAREAQATLRTRLNGAAA